MVGVLSAIVDNILVLLAVLTMKRRIAKGARSPLAMHANGSIALITEAVYIHIRK